jgi:HK97 family phage major capsid protein
LGIERVKQLAETYEGLKTLLESDQDIANANVKAAKVDANVSDDLAEDDIMTYKQDAPELTADAIGDAVGAQIKGAFETLTERFEGLETALKEALPADDNGGFDVEVTGDEADRELEGRPFKSFGDFLQTLATDRRDQRLKPVRVGEYYDVTKAMGPDFVGSLQAAKMATKAPTGLQEGIPSAGGFLVGQDRQAGLMGRVYNVGNLLQRTDMVGISAGSNGMTFYAEDETSRVNGSRRGGIRAYWAAEAAEKTASEPKFREMELKLKKLIGLVYATDELIADANALESWIMQNLPEELSFVAEDSIFNGTGVGMPLGFMNSGALISVAKETGQAAATIVAENISKMWARRWLGGRNYVWLYNQDVEPELDNLNLPVGTGGSLVYMPPGGLSDAPYGRIKGVPAIPIEYAATLGTVGDLVLADMSQYQMIDKGGTESASSIHVRFIYDETVFRFVYRVDGQPKWDTALTPFKGTNTVSPFVALATRA